MSKVKHVSETPATRFLTQQGVVYTEHPYEYQEHGGTAVSAVLAYRLVTFWLPTVPGYWCFTWLTKKGAL